MKMLAVIVMVSPVFLSSCSWDPNGINAQREWIAQKEKERSEYEKRVANDQVERIKRQKDESERFEKSHPEVLIDKIDVDSAAVDEKGFASALNKLDFVTRYPGTQTIDNSYVKVGTYNLTVRRFQVAMEGYSNECKRISAYNNTDYKSLCISSLTKGINDFAAMLKNGSIPDKTKVAALNDASYGNYIDFEHAARLAVMHFKLCQQKGNIGYVEMVTTAVPCSGRGDVLNIDAAKKMGFL
ncbi:hypothetical protein [Serratia marcescens]|uniref:hypothetical protein n=1 Tax=Serratia marcescens TaxID=615 RepID=UPI000744FDF2|nr:hypothetical protein [Serratia marcescens]AXX17704.1 hypothetical protein C7M66_00335 [Serratia marcescens]AXX24877.1 hypothetical protein C7M65_12790 [Serratia marcescens]RTE99225.1 hypothetical protein C7M70_12320 [Serratia marcescens]RTF00635.1 hypothetical protein C7M68_17300 [Serratia marcescens]RTF08505.1 hypothetical protein C7M69_08540 [Serratia marcescens]